MEEGKADPPKDDPSDSEGESNESEISQSELDKNLLECAKNNKIEDVNMWLDKGASPLYEADGWNPLLWAACNGNEDIVRALIKRNACAPYLN